MNTLVHNQVSAPRTAGSFWLKNTTETARRQSQVLTQAGGLQGWSALQSGLQAVLQLPRAETQRAWRYQVKNIVRLGPDLSERYSSVLGAADGRVVVYRRPDQYDLGIAGYVPLDLKTSQVENVLDMWATEDCAFLLFPSTHLQTVFAPTLEELRNTWVVPCPHQYEPWALQGNRVLLQGIDFLVQPGSLIFREHPDNLFPERIITLMNGRRRSPNLYRFPLGVDDPSPGPWLMEYYRERQSPAAFLRAIAQAAGLVVMPQDGTVLEARSFCGNHWYRFEWGTLELPYDHVELEVGSFHPRGEVLGDVLTLRGAHEAQRWWEAPDLDWSAGISMAELTGVPSTLVFQAGQVRADAVNVEGANIHARLHWEGDTADLETYWNNVEAVEKRTGNYLNNVVGLSTVDSVKYVNGHNVIFENLLGRRGLLLQMRTRNIGQKYHGAAIKFARRHTPLGLLLLIRDL